MNKKSLKLYIHYINKSRKVIRKQTKYNRHLNKKRSRTKNQLVLSKIRIKDDPILEYLISVNFSKKCRKRVKKYRGIGINASIVTLPNRFSFITNTNETIKVLKNIIYLATREKNNGFDIDFRKTEHLSLCASTVLSVLMLSIVKKSEINDDDLQIKGKLDYVNNPEVYEMVTASGLKKMLQVVANEDGEEVSQDIITFDILTPEGNKLITNKKHHSDADNVATEITKYFQKCLKTQNFELNLSGKNLFRKMVGEVIDNCVLHAGLENSWFSIGYAKVKEEYVECKLVIFNFGNSIYETIMNSSVIDETPKKLKEIYNKMGAFHFSEENIITYLALQDGVSRFYNTIPSEDGKEGPDRGTGTIKLIKEFNTIGKTRCGKKPIMAIISGNTKILIDTEYPVKESIFSGEKREVVVFNDSGDLYTKPNEKNIIKLSEKFPGTLISMEFYLQDTFLDKFSKEDFNS